MEPLFTSAKVVLTTDFVRLFSTEKLISTLRDVQRATGVDFSAVSSNVTDTAYALAGSWEQVNEAYERLEQCAENINACPNPTDCISGEGVSNENKDGLNDLDLVDCNNDRCEVNLEPDYDNTLLNDTRTQTTTEITNENGNSNSNAESSSKMDREITVEQTRHSFLWPKPQKMKALKHLKNRLTPKVQSRRIKDEKSKIIAPNCKETKKVISLSTTKKIKNISEKNKEEIRPACKKIPLKSRTSSKENSQPKNNKNNVDNVKQSKLSQEAKKKKSQTRKPGDAGYWSRVKITNYNEKHKCEHCEVVLKSRKRYMEHLRRIHIKEFQCDVCKRRFGYPTDLHRHKCVGMADPNNEQKHKGGRPKKEKTSETVFLPCPECDYIGTSRKRFNSHVRRTHRLTFKCDKCTKKFGFVRDLQRHKENVHAGPSHFCDKCSKMYKSKAVFDLHLKTHEEGFQKPRHECVMCGKVFTTKYVLTTHMKTAHFGIKNSYLCQICGKSFKQRNSYKQHANAHAGIKPYLCDLCGKAFTYQKSLKEHRFMHDSIRRFQCQLCDKAFRQRTTLQIHMKVHKTVKDYICLTCGKGFSQKQALERHDRIHTGVKPYTCIPCQRTFGDASTIRRHMMAIHQKTEKNWREDIVCNVRRRTDYYVAGGSGHHRSSLVDTSEENIERKTTSENNAKSDNLILQEQPKYQTLNSVDTALFMLNTSGASVDFSNIFIPSVSLTNLDQIQASDPLPASSNGFNSQLNHTGPQYSVPSSQSLQQQVNSALSVNLGGHFINLNGLNQIKLEQHPQVGKLLVPLPGQQTQVGFQPQQQQQSSGQQHHQQQQENRPQQQQHPQQDSRHQQLQIHNPQVQQQQMTAVQISGVHNLVTDSSLLPMTPVSDGGGNLSGMTGETGLSQTIGNVWGFVGYPSFQSAQSNNTQYQSQPSQ